MIRNIGCKPVQIRRKLRRAGGAQKRCADPCVPPRKLQGRRDQRGAVPLRDLIKFTQHLTLVRRDGTVVETCMRGPGIDEATRVQHSAHDKLAAFLRRQRNELVTRRAICQRPPSGHKQSVGGIGVDRCKMLGHGVAPDAMAIRPLL